MLKGAHIPNVYLNGVLVEQVDSVKYIGHFLTCELNDIGQLSCTCLYVQRVCNKVLLLLLLCRYSEYLC